MKKSLYLISLLALGSAVHAEGEAPEATFQSDEQKYSYALGYEFGVGLMRQGIPVELDMYFLGVEDAMGRIAPKLSHEEGRALLVKLQQELRDKQMAEMQKQAAENAVLAAEFLKENANKDGVKSTDSGLQYEVIREGNGPKPSVNSTVTVHYIGMLPDGTVFDSSVERGEPATFGLGQVIPGWTEGLQLMSLGAKYKLTIPPQLGYGERGAPPRIPGNSALVFEVELLSME